MVCHCVGPGATVQRNTICGNAPWIKSGSTRCQPASRLFTNRYRARSFGLKSMAVSIKEPLQMFSSDKLRGAWKALVGFEGNLCSAAGRVRRADVDFAAMTRLLRFFRPSHQHTAFSATLLLMA